MKVCITSLGETLNAEVDPRFGRAAYFLIFETLTNDFEVIPNTNASAGGGVGIKSAQLLVDNNVEMLLTGDVGPKAFDVLNTAGIRIVTGISGTVRDALNNANPK